MASRSENNSPNHENQNENDKNGNGVLRQRKTISPSHSRRSSAPNLKFLEQQTSSNSNNRSRSVFRFKSNLIVK